MFGFLYGDRLERMSALIPPFHKPLPDHRNAQLQSQ